MVKKYILPIILLIFICSLTVWKANKAITVFNETNVSVYDGVMGEKNQIRRYHNFQDNFSWGNRYSQAYYEFFGGSGGSGYSAVVTFLCPTCLLNNSDLLIRSFFSLLVFSLIFYFLLPIQLSKIGRIGFIVALYQLPLFYHFRYGLATHIFEIPSILLLLSAFILVWRFIIDNKWIWLFLASCFVFLSLFYRLNFFVYAILLFVVFLPLLISTLKKLPLKRNKLLFPLLTGLVLILSIVYIKINWEAFMAYYDKPVAYSETSVAMAFSSCFEDFKNQITGWGIAIFITLSFVIGASVKESNTISKRTVFQFLLPILVIALLNLFIGLLLPDYRKEMLKLSTSLYCLTFLVLIFLKKKETNLFNDVGFLIYPSLLFICFILIITQSVNNPHVSTIISVSLFLFVIPFSAFLKKIINSFNEKVVSVVKLVSFSAFIVALIGLNYSFVETLDKYKQPRKELELTNEVALYIADQVQSEDSTESYSYMVFYDAMQEVPIDVAVFHKTGKWLASKELFVVNDWNYYDISKNLDTDELISYYISVLETKKPELIVIGSELRTNIQNYHKNAVVVHKAIYEWVLQNENYIKTKEVFTDYEGLVGFYEQK